MPASRCRDLAVAATLAIAVAGPLGCLAGIQPVTPTAALATTPVAAAAPAPVAPACAPAPLPVRAAAALVVGLPNITTADEPLAKTVTQLGISGIFLEATNVRSASQLRRLVAGLRAESPRPIVVTTDAESGRVSVLRDVIGGGPSPRRLARQKTPAEVTAFAAALGAKLHDLGVDLDLAPVLDLDDGPYNGIIGDRSFGTDPDKVTTYASAFRNGLAQAGVLAAVKHFPGQGRSGADTHLRAATVSTPVSEIVTHDLVPFQRLIDAGAPVVMMNHLDYTDLGGDVPASLSPSAYALLRSMGFNGVAITDSLGMGAVNTRWDVPEAAVRAIAAGADAAFATDGAEATRMRDALVAAVISGRIPEARLNQAVARMAKLTGADDITCGGGA